MVAVTICRDFGNQENKICYCFHFFPIYLPWSYGTRSSLVAQMIKLLPAMWETWVWSLGWEDPLEKEMATHSSILAWRIPWTEKPGGLQSMGSQRVVHDWATSFSFPFMGPDAMILVFWTLSFKPGFSLLSLIFIKMLFRSFSFSGTRVVSLCIWHCWYSPGNLDSILWVIQPGILHAVLCIWVFLGGSVIKNLSAMQETSCNAVDTGSTPGLGRSLQKEMASHSSILAGKSHRQRSLASYSLWGPTSWA